MRRLQPQTLIGFKQGATGTEDFAAPERKGQSLADRVRKSLDQVPQGFVVGHDLPTIRDLDAVLGLSASESVLAVPIRIRSRLAAVIGIGIDGRPDLSENDLDIVKAHVLTGDPGTTITDYANEHAADLIVIPSHGYHGMKRLVLGSVAERVIRHAHCSVLVLRRSDAS